MNAAPLFLSILSLTAPLASAQEPMLERDGEGLEILQSARQVKRVDPFTSVDLGFETPRMGALKAVHYTLSLNPQVELQRATVDEQRGRVRSEYGPFDTHITGKIAKDSELNSRRMHDRETRDPARPPTEYPNPLRYRNSVADYEIGIRKRLANGIEINPTVGFSQKGESDYGETFQNDSRGSVGFNITIPLGRGGGKQWNLAPLEASRFDLLASTLQLRHITSQSVATALESYWATRAAEETYRLRLEAEEISARLLEVGVILAEGDELAPVELAQMIADRHQTMALRVRSEAALISSRQRMATAIGMPASSLLMSPLAQDTFPEPPRDIRFPKAADLIDVALSLRDDLRAARQTAISRKVLMSASYLNLRPTVDLRLGGSYAPFETRNQHDISSGNHWRAGAELSIDWPVENNEAKGSIMQHEARYQSSLISVSDAQRVITSQVVVALADLKSAATNVHLFREAAEWYRKALTAQEELFALGQGNLSDTITAHQRLVDAQMNYVSARQNYATSLVQLRFACGLLLFADEGGSWVDPHSWTQIPLVKK